MSVQRSWVPQDHASDGAPTHRIWDNSRVASDHGSSGLCSRRSFSPRTELCPVVSRGRTHTGVSEFCTWPRPGKPVFGLVHLGVCSLGASDRVEWVEVETDIRMGKSVFMTSNMPCPRDTLGSLHSNGRLMSLT